jgi:hypothetical protein
MCRPFYTLKQMFVYLKELIADDFLLQVSAAGAVAMCHAWVVAHYMGAPLPGSNVHPAAGSSEAPAAQKRRQL